MPGDRPSVAGQALLRRGGLRRRGLRAGSGAAAERLYRRAAELFDVRTPMIAAAWVLAIAGYSSMSHRVPDTGSWQEHVATTHCHAELSALDHVSERGAVAVLTAMRHPGTVLIESQSVPMKPISITRAEVQ